MISICNPDIKKYSYSAQEAINSGWISNHGEYIQKSTNKLKEITGVKHVILMTNGTCATHCLFLSLKYMYPNIKKIYVPNNCYIAAWNCALMEYDKTNLDVMKMDINTWNIKIDDEYINSLEMNSAMLIVHNLGNIINVPHLKRLRPDIIYIEDNCEGFTGKYENIYSGTSNSTLCSSISFYGNKIITTGEGGAFLTNDDNVYNYISKVYSQGMSEIRYLHNVHAYNYRMTNIQAAFLFDQLNDIETILNNKKRIFENYKILLEPLIKKGYISLFAKELNTDEANWIFSLRLLNNKKNIEETNTYFKENNIDIRPFFYPISEHKHLSDINFEDDVPKILNNSIIMIPSSPTITYQEQKKVVDYITNFVKNYKFIEINNTNIYLLKEFISFKEIPDTFRYFKKNNIDIIKNHIITFLIYENDKIAGYFHIDYEKEDNTYWLGLCILPLYQNKRYGTKILEYIFNHHKIINISNIKLSVDNDNIYAIKLYKNFGFNIINIYEKNIIMLKDNNCSLTRQINRWKYLERPNIINLKCFICDYYDNINKYKIFKSKDMFNAGELIRYECPKCNVIFGDLRFLFLSDYEFNEDYKDLFSYYEDGITYHYIYRKLLHFNLLDKEKTYLDFACGSGKTAENLKNIGYNIIGYDKYIKNDFVKNDISNLKFDIVYCNNYIEHLKYPLEQMYEMLNYVQDNGYLIIMSDAFDEFMLDMTHYHTFFFTGKSFEVLCEKLNLKIINSFKFEDDKTKIKILQKII